MQKIATLEKIEDIQPHSNADSLEVATIQGYRVVVKKGEFKVGDVVIYIEPDSIITESARSVKCYAFLEKAKWRIRGVKFRGVFSSGLVMPLYTLNSFGWYQGAGDKEVDEQGNPYYTFCKLSDSNSDEDFLTCKVLQVGSPVWELIGVQHYEKPVDESVSGMPKGNFPNWIPKTDESSLKSSVKDISLFVGKEVVITRKWDGSSGTFYIKNGVFGVCSRKLELQRSDNSVFWKLAEKYDLENKMKLLGEDFAIQGECVGPKINGNHCGLKDYQLFIFNGVDRNGRYWDHDKLFDFCAKYNIPTVDIIYRGVFNYTIDELKTLSDSLKYPSGEICEGIVIRPVNELYDSLGNRLSRKIVSELYLLKYKE